MGAETIIAMGAQTVPNFLIIRKEWWSTIHRLPADVQIGMICCNISKNHTIFSRDVDNKCYYEAKMNYVTTLVMCDDDLWHHQ